MRYFEHIIVGLAMEPVDADLLAYAQTVVGMGRSQTRCTFVHVLPPADLAAQGNVPVRSLGEARAALQQVVANAFGSTDGHDVKVVSGHLIDSLLAEVADGGADLIMVGHRKTARGRRSLSRRLAIKAPCSVWMVPEGSQPRITGVLTAIDLSLPSAQALSMATLVANRAGLNRCAVLHVLAPSPLGFDLVERESVERALDRFLSPLDLHGIAIAKHIEEAASVAAPVSTLVEKHQLDLVVVGTRGRSPSAAVLLGSESEHVLVESRVPVLITKEPGERIGVLKALLDRDFVPRYRPRFG